jgi:hypothetical protein
LSEKPTNHMRGLLLKLRDDKTGAPGRWFWKLFRPVRQDLDRLYWCFPFQPFMGAPGFIDDESATVKLIGLETGRASSPVQVWCPGALARYADHFGQEFIELWGIEPTRDDAQMLAVDYYRAPESEKGRFIEEHGRVWLLYTDSTCWEIYARKPRLLDEVRRELWNKPWVEVFESDTAHRKAAFSAAGIGHWIDRL